MVGAGQGFSKVPIFPSPHGEKGERWGDPTPRQGAAVPGLPDPVPLGTLLHLTFEKP